MAKKPEKEEVKSLLRTPKPKKTLGLKVPEIMMPHLELIRGDVENTVNARSSDARVDDNRTPGDFSTGRPAISDVDARLRSSQTPGDDIGGLPADVELDAHISQNRMPGNPVAGLPITPSPDARITTDRTSDDTSTGSPTHNKQDAQTVNKEASGKQGSGLPMIVEPDTLAPKDASRTPGKTHTAGAQAPGAAEPDAQRKEKEATWEKNRSTERLQLRVNPALLKKVKKHCVDRDFTLSEFWELSALRFLELDAQAAGEPGALAPLDDRRLKMIFKTKPFIINLYLGYTAAFNEKAVGSTGKWSGKWLPRDDQAAAIYNDVDPKVIELGIIQTQSNKSVGNGKIQTFQYYTSEINAVIEQNLEDKTLEIILQHHRATMFRLLGREVDLSFLDNTKGSGAA